MGFTGNFLERLNQMSPRDKISKAKIALYEFSPFFGYIVENLTFVEDTKGVLPYETMGVNEKGLVYYSPEFVNKLQMNAPDQLVGVIAHEACHPSFDHITRGKGRGLTINGHSVWNWAIDIITNYFLLENGFSLPEKSILPVNGEITILEKTITNIANKSAEEIYDELKAELKQMVKEGKAKLIPNGGYETDSQTPGDFDVHTLSGEGSPGESSSSGKAGGEEIPKPKKVDWQQVVADAYNHAKLRGSVPAGIERVFEDLSKPKVNWKTVIKRNVSAKIRYDTTYSKPNKKYLCHDLIIPGFYGESMKVICSIDTSGSISQAELELYVSEMVGMARAFDQAEFVILTHDTEVHDCIRVMDSNVNKIKNLKIHGGGGTDHRPVFEYINDNKLKKVSKLLISFTDGYSEFPEQRPNVETIFVLAGAHVEPSQMPSWARTLVLPV